jgi:hypothetical protein
MSFDFRIIFSPPLTDLTLPDLRLLLQVPGPVEMAKTASIDWNLLEKLETNLKKRDLVALKYSVKFFCTAALNHFYPLGFDHA